MAFSFVRTCASCGAKNRVGARHLVHNARCGRCKTPLGPVQEPIDADAETLAEITQEAQAPILVDFWAEWCGPCKMAAPHVRDLAREMAGRAIVLKVDTEAHPEVGARYGVQAIPNFVVFKNGRVVQQHAGLAPKPAMRAWLERAASAEASR